MTKRTRESEAKRISLDLLLSVRSPPRLSPLKGGGISPLDLLELPPDLSTVMKQAIHVGQTTAAKVAESMQIDIAKAEALLKILMARGHLRSTGEGPEDAYRPILGQNRRPRLSSSLWEILEE